MPNVNIVIIIQINVQQLIFFGTKNGEAVNINTLGIALTKARKERVLAEMPSPP